MDKERELMCAAVIRQYGHESKVAIDFCRMAEDEREYDADVEIECRKLLA